MCCLKIGLIKQGFRLIKQFFITGIKYAGGLINRGLNKRGLLYLKCTDIFKDLLARICEHSIS